MASFVIENYDPAWPRAFERLRRTLAGALGEAAVAVEHVGSTSVPGLAGKPIIDIDVVVASPADLATAIERLKGLGYEHEGDLGVPEREAFSPPKDDEVRRHVHACVAGAQELRRRLAFRDRLRSDPGAARAYEALKRRLAAEHPDDGAAYADGKRAWIRALMHDAG